MYPWLGSSVGSIPGPILTVSYGNPFHPRIGPRGDPPMGQEAGSRYQRSDVHPAGGGITGNASHPAIFACHTNSHYAGRLPQHMALASCPCYPCPNGPHPCGPLDEGVQSWRRIHHLFGLSWMWS